MRWPSVGEERQQSYPRASITICLRFSDVCCNSKIKSLVLKPDWELPVHRDFLSPVATESGVETRVMNFGVGEAW
jgi:hypothetical protein